MTKTLKLVLVAILACLCQTNFVQYIRIAGIAPDMLIVFLVLLTTYTGTYGGFCAGSLMAMLYDASVGYVLAVNLVSYAFFGWAAPNLRAFLDNRLRKLKHKSVMVMMLICFFLTLLREIIYIGYLFLIGSEQSVITVLRALLCAGYSALMILPAGFLLRRIMRWHLPAPRKQADWADEKPLQ